MIADIYIRVSSQPQAQGHGLIRQEEACRKWCEMHKVTVRKVIKDVCSAFRTNSQGVPFHLDASSRNPNHGNLGRYLKSLQRDPPDLFVFEDWDRVDRSLSMFTIIGAFHSAKVKMISVYKCPNLQALADWKKHRATLISFSERESDWGSLSPLGAMELLAVFNEAVAKLAAVNEGIGCTSISKRIAELQAKCVDLEALLAQVGYSVDHPEVAEVCRRFREPPALKALDDRYYMIQLNAPFE